MTCSLSAYDVNLRLLQLSVCQVSMMLMTRHRAVSCPVLAWRATLIPPPSLSTRVARWQLQVLVARPWEWVLLPQVLLP